MEITKAVEAGRHPLPLNETFRTVAESHRQDLQRVRERNRRRRLRYLFYLNLLVFAYLMRRAFEGRPLQLGLPQMTADDMVWLLPLFIMLAVGASLALPLISGRSPHVKFTPDQIGITFADVRGIDIVLEEVTRTLQIFLTYKSFREELGGNPRRGILFEGKPGTGKTHLAKAMAAEAGVPFYFVSAPSFQSMFYGMTAFKIRSFFKALKKAARKEGGAIGFIEEIDAVGGSRGGVLNASASLHRSVEPGSVSRMVSPGGGDSGMVNELLIQMQSFETPPFWGRFVNKIKDVFNAFLPAETQLKRRAAAYSNVLLIGATNLAEALDPALLRPGRFDRILYFDVPSRAGRRDLVDYFLAKRAHAPEMDREDLRQELAAMTLGYTPAMLEHVLDEAIVWAIRDGRKELNWQDIQRARLTEEIGLGQPVSYTERERNIIATHEAGHAVAAYVCGKDRKLEVLSIIKRRSALGLLAHSDTEERFTKTESELRALLKVMLGGMASEDIFFGETGTGPSSDLAAATALAAQMVGSYGMGSSLISYEAVQSGMHSGANLVAKVLSNDDARKEVDSLLRDTRAETRELLVQNRRMVEALRDALLEREELLGEEILAVLEKAAD
jgi:ATP-dependent Zn protease